MTVLPSDHKTVSSRALAVDGSSARSQHCLRAPRTTTLKTGTCGWIAAKIFGHASRQVSTNFRITPAVSCDNHQRYFSPKRESPGADLPLRLLGIAQQIGAKKAPRKGASQGGKGCKSFPGAIGRNYACGRADTGSLVKANQLILHQKVYRSGRRASVPNQPLRGSCTTGPAKVTACQIGDMTLPRGLHSCWLIFAIRFAWNF